MFLTLHLCAFKRHLSADVNAPGTEAPAQAKMEYPQGDLSFLQGINAIGNKFMMQRR
jgi:hypothetical protein